MKRLHAARGQRRLEHVHGAEQRDRMVSTGFLSTVSTPAMDAR